MEAAPRLVDISEKRAARREAAPLTGDLLARKGEAVSAARDVLNAQGTGPLPPAEPREEARSAKSSFAKPWIAIVAVLLVGGAVGAGYALRPAIEAPQAVAESKPAQTTVAAATVQEAPGLSPAAGPSTAKDTAGRLTQEDSAPVAPKAMIAASAPPAEREVPDANSPRSLPVTPVSTAPAENPLPPVATPIPVPQSPAVPKALSIPAPPKPAAPQVPPQIAANTATPSVPPPPKTVPAPPNSSKSVREIPAQATTKPEPTPAALVPKAPKPAAIKPSPPARPQLAAKTAPAAGTTAPVAKPPYLIQLVSVKSNAAANREWTRLQKRFAGLFGGLEPSFRKR